MCLKIDIQVKGAISVALLPVSSPTGARGGQSTAGGEAHSCFYLSRNSCMKASGMYELN